MRRALWCCLELDKEVAHRICERRLIVFPRPNVIGIPMPNGLRNVGLRNVRLSAYGINGDDALRPAPAREEVPESAFSRLNFLRSPAALAPVRHPPRRHCPEAAVASILPERRLVLTLIAITASAPKAGRIAPSRGRDATSNASG